MVELKDVLTTADRTLMAAGRRDVVDRGWDALGLAIELHLAAAVGRAVEADVACAGRRLDARADMLLLVFAVRAHAGCQSR